MTYEIRPVADDDFFGWMPLFEAYCRFYESELDDTKALTVWTWLRDEDDPLQAILAVDDEGRPIGLAHYRVVPDSLLATRALIEYVHARAAEHGTGGVRWITAADNTEAQQLYDAIARRTTWITYEMDA